MRVEIVDYADNWQTVKNAAMNTIGAESGKYPDTKWKRKMLLAEHSPIRLLELTVRITDVPYFVVMHLVRHRVGIEHFVATQRTDRTGIDRTQLPQGALVNYTFRANAQAFIAISRKRLCGQAAKETRAARKASQKAAQKPRKDDRTIIREFIRNTYGSAYKARIQAAEKTPDRIITSRAGKRTVYVDMFITKADSPDRGHVITAGPFKGNRIRYAHHAKRGDVVKVYYIYNPHTNADDDITAIISGGKIRK